MNPPTVDRREGPSPRTILLLIGFLSLIWGSTWLVVRGGLRDLPPFASAGVHFALAGAVMVLVAGRLHRREGGERPALRSIHSG